MPLCSKEGRSKPPSGARWEAALDLETKSLLAQPPLSPTLPAVQGVGWCASEQMAGCAEATQGPRAGTGVREMGCLCIYLCVYLFIYFCDARN